MLNAMSQQRVLLVDDQAFVRTAVRAMLENVGCHSISEAECGRDALAFMRSVLPTMVICDIAMKPTDGFNFLRMMRSGKHGFFNIPFIFLTGHADAEVVHKAAHLGVDGYLLKPTNANSLMAAIEKAQKKHGQRLSPPDMRVLIVDDDPVVRKALHSMLKAQGCNSVIEAENGDKAVELMRQALPSLVVSDVGMAPVDGFALVQELRGSNHNLFDIPIIFLTNHGEVESVRRALKMGVDGYLLKPVNALKLHDKIDEVLAARRRK